MSRVAEGEADSTSWSPVLVGFVALTVHTGVRYTFGILLPFMVEDLNGSLTVVTAAFSVHMLSYTLVAPWAGHLITTKSPRFVLLCGAGLVGGAFALAGLAQATWQVLIVYGLIAGAASHGFGVIAANNVVVPRFQTRRRGLAIGVTNSGVSFGAAVFPPLVALIVSWVGWRTAWPVVGGVVVVVLVALAIFLAPREATDEPSDAEAESGLSQAQFARLLLSDHRFRYVSIGFFLSMSVQQVIVVHLAGSGLERGLDVGQTGLAIGVLGLTGVVLRIGFAGWSDRLENRTMIAVPGTIAMVSGTSLLFATSSSVGYWCAIPLLGAGMSIYGPLFAMMIADVFPDYPYARTMGMGLIGVGVGSSLGPVLFAFLREVGMSDGQAWMTFGCFSAVSLLALLAGSRNPAPATSH